jgi:hypothetical protein
MNIKHGGEAGKASQQVGLQAIKSDWIDREFLNECGRLNSSHGTSIIVEKHQAFSAIYPQMNYHICYAGLP